MRRSIGRAPNLVAPATCLGLYALIVILVRSNDGASINYGRPFEEVCRQVASIHVQTLSGARIELEVDLTDTVEVLKEKIYETTGVPVGVQRLRANKREPQVIADDDRLCDLGLRAGSSVHMYLYSERITSPEQVALLQERPVARSVRPHGAPIFHEAEDVGEPARCQPASLYKDSRNWVVHSSSRPSSDPDLFDPAANLAPNPDNEASIEIYRQYLEIATRPDLGEWYRLEAAMNRARIKLSSSVRPYRVAANLTTRVRSKQRPSITLGGGSTDVGLKQSVPLGADVNNWAPDGFTDSDAMRLFEVAERVRQALARAAQTGEGILGVASQRQINREILFAYLVALAGYPRPVEHKQAREDEKCGICIDELIAESAIKLACEHAFHADCVRTWASDLYRQGRAPNCPFCRQRFSFPYEDLGKAELERPELQGATR